MTLPNCNFLKSKTGIVEVPKKFLEFKSINNASAEIKDIDFKNRIVSCYWSAFNNKDFDDDIMVQGCYKKSIAENGPQGANKIFYLKSHNWENPLGKPTLLQEDSKGLYAEIPVTSGATFAEDTLKLMDAGLMIQNSVGFQTVKYNTVMPDENDWQTWYREILEVKLYEGSAVVLGANEDTPFQGFKSMTPAELVDLESKIFKTLRSDNLRDETYERLEFAIKQLQRETYLLGQSEKSLTENEQPKMMKVSCPECNKDMDVDDDSSEMECPYCKCMFTKSFTVTKRKPKGAIGAIASIKINL